MSLTVINHAIFPVKVILAVCIILCLSNGTSFAKDSVSGHYITASGTQIVLVLSVGSPAPSGLIVEQYLSPGNHIIGTSPNAKKIDVDSGIVKWLFRKTLPGEYTLTTQLSQPLSGSISATVRYRTPGGGKLIERLITP